MDFLNKTGLTEWYRKYWIHLLVWSLYMFYEIVVIGTISGVFGPPLNYILHYMIIILLFYWHADVLLPWAFQQKNFRPVRIMAIILFETSVFIIASYFADILLTGLEGAAGARQLSLSYLYCLKMLYRGALFLGFGTGYYYLKIYINERRKTNELEKQRLNEVIERQKAEQELTKAQNAFLKAQISPHFLFNVLDFVYHSIVDLSPIAADAIIHLSEMMRYAIDSDKNGDFICLGDEIEQVEKFIYLTNLKDNGKIKIEFHFEESVCKLNFIPLVLLTLIENIFKHGDLSKSPATARIYICEGFLSIDTENLVNKSGMVSKGYIGLINIKSRLQYAYGEKMQFVYFTDSRNLFKTTIKVPLDVL